MWDNGTFVNNNPGEALVVSTKAGPIGYWVALTEWLLDPNRDKTHPPRSLTYSSKKNEMILA